jgi:hypothetical protein
MPSFDQSVATHVGFDFSKICTPSSISLIITCFDSSNKRFSSSFLVDPSRLLLGFAREVEWELGCGGPLGLPRDLP